jgi:hypothetical protein
MLGIFDPAGITTEVGGRDRSLRSTSLTAAPTLVRGSVPPQPLPRELLLFPPSS